MNKKMKRILRSISVFLSLVICVWCVGIKLQGISAADSISALLFATGLTGEAETSKTDPVVSGVAQDDKKPEEENMILNENDGIVPFHQDEFPTVSHTPDPDRATLPVEAIQASGGSQIDNFYVKDNTGSGTDLAAELLNDPSINIQANGEIEVLLYHTHTSEAYLEAGTDFYYTDMETRSLNQDMSVVAVGREIKAELEKAGIGVIHDTTVCDTMFNGSYARSWEVLQSNLEQYPTIQVTIDIHRDSMTTEEGVKYKPTAQIEGRNAAQIMLIAGCDANGDWGDFPDWIENLRFALRVQQKASELYPDLMRPLNFSNSKYNMNATTGSLLIEVGTEVNSVSEAKYSGQLMGRVLCALFTEE